jgi:hypothetical protein
MFLFRKRKEDAGHPAGNQSENPADEFKLEENIKVEKISKPVKTAAVAKQSGKAGKEKPARKTEADAPAKDPFFQSEDSLQILESDTPVKVVIPASSLIEDEIEIPEKAIKPELPGELVDEEVVDGLFEKVNEGKNLEEEEDDISLEAILPLAEKKVSSPAADKKPQPSAEKSQPVKPSAETPAPVQTSPSAKAAPPAEGAAKVPPAASMPAAADEKNNNMSADTAAMAAGLAAANTAAAASAAAANAAAASALTSAASALAGAASASAQTAGSKAPAAAADGKTAAPAADAAKKPGEAEKDKKKGGEEENKGNLFSQLFSKVEEAEETPLDRLIKTLPEITMEEVVNEAEEVKGLMSEWFQNQAK